jgi:chaperonin GroEL
MLYEQAQRAIKVLSMAQRSGVLPGAGAGLHYCIPALEQALQGSRQTGELSGDVAAGVQVLMRALSAPLRQIVTNAGVNAPNVVLHQLSERGAPYTYDVAKHEVSDAYACGVFDVLEITSGVLQTAVSGALMALTTDAIVYHKKPKDSLEP